MLISHSHHFLIESEAPVVRNPEVMVKHQPGSGATTIYEPRCGTRRHVCFFLYLQRWRPRGMLKFISFISESLSQKLDRHIGRGGHFHNTKKEDTLWHLVRQE